MRRLLLQALFLTFCTLAAAAEPVQIEVVRMSPTSGFVLPRFGTIYMEIAYQADQPLRLQARAYFGGKSLDKGQAMNATVIHPAGSGRALVWVRYSEPAVIDEIRVTAYDEKWQPLATLPVERPAQWLAKPADKYVEPPEWVEVLMEAERKTAEQYGMDHPPEPDPVGNVLVAFMLLAVPGYFVLQVVALSKQRGRWRLASMAPLLIMVPAALHAMLALGAGSNLWPIMLIFAAPIGFLYLGGVFALRWVRGDSSYA